MTVVCAHVAGSQRFRRHFGSCGACDMGTCCEVHLRGCHDGSQRRNRGPEAVAQAPRVPAPAGPQTLALADAASAAAGGRNHYRAPHAKRDQERRPGEAAVGDGGKQETCRRHEGVALRSGPAHAGPVMDAPGVSASVPQQNPSCGGSHTSTRSLHVYPLRSTATDVRYHIGQARRLHWMQRWPQLALTVRKGVKDHAWGAGQPRARHCTSLRCRCSWAD